MGIQAPWHNLRFVEMVGNQRKIGVAGGDEGDGDDVDPEDTCEALSFECRWGQLKIVGPGKQIAGSQKHRHRQHSGDEEPPEGGLIAATDEQNAAHHQWSGDGAELIECLMQSKSPAEPGAARGVRQHRIAHRRADAATHAFGNDQHDGDLPITGERQERYREQVEQVPGDGNRPILPRPVAEIA